MKDVQDVLEAFFGEYEARLNRALVDPAAVDVEATVSAFAPCFIEANPAGVICGKNDEQFLAAIPKGYEFYRAIGTQYMRILSKAITVLDDYHAMVKVHWVAAYKKQDDHEVQIEFDVIYFVQLINETPKIFGYITGDEQKAYQELGLLAE